MVVWCGGDDGGVVLVVVWCGGDDGGVVWW